MLNHGDDRGGLWFDPSEVANAIEHKTPSVARRIAQMAKLAQHGWPIGLRFDPLITGVDWRGQHDRLLMQFSEVPSEQIHSVSYGPLRFPKAMHRDIVRLYPDSPLFAEKMENDAGMIAYPSTLEEEMAAFCEERLLHYVPKTVFFQCTPEKA